MLKKKCDKGNISDDLVSTSGNFETLKNRFIPFGEVVEVEKVKEMMARQRSSRNRYSAQKSSIFNT